VVHRGGEDGSFFCEHCDYPCDIKPCELCTAHFLFNAEEAREGFRQYQEPEEEEE